MERILFVAKRREGRFAAGARATDGLAVDLRPRGRAGAPPTGATIQVGRCPRIVS
jgi:hypothetical protein